MSDIQNENFNISTAYLVDLLCKNVGIINCVDYAKQQGWIDDFDVVNQQEMLTRKQAARIIHNYLKIELNEKDIMEIGSAADLKDLYDCRVCVNHVAQVYLKGIMSAILIGGITMFGMNYKISKCEIHQICERVFHVNSRLKLNIENELDYAKNEYISELVQYVDINGIKQNIDDKTLVIDLRSEAEYKDNICIGAFNLKLVDIINRKYDSLFFEKQVIVYCNNGYQSQIAANYISELTKKKVLYSSLV